MFVDGSGSNGLMILFDWRTEKCQEDAGVHRFWGFGRRTMGPDWEQACRVSLRDWKQPVLKAAEIKAIRPVIDRIIKDRNINTVCVLQMPEMDTQHKSNNAWNLYYPGSPFGWFGTVQRVNGYNLTVVPNPRNYEWATHWQIAHQYANVVALAKGTAGVREWGPLITEGDYEASLGSLRHVSYLSVDIETNVKKTVISCIGISDGRLSISVPWDDFLVSGTSDWQLGAAAPVKDAVRALLASTQPKIGHNIAFDIFNLRRCGFEVNGPVEDTMLMSHSIFPQFRKGLQQCVAMCFLVEPWKSIHKPPRLKEGDAWLATPAKTRVYNAKDAMATAWLYDKFSEWLA